MKDFLINNRPYIQRKLVKKITIALPLHHENLNTYLSPILGQYAISTDKFLESVFTELQKTVFFKDILNDLYIVDSEQLFGEVLENWELISEVGLILPVFTEIYNSSLYKINLRKPLIGFLFKFFTKQKIRKQTFQMPLFYLNKTFFFKRKSKKIIQCRFYYDYFIRHYLNILAIYKWIVLYESNSINLFKQLRASVYNRWL